MLVMLTHFKAPLTSFLLSLLMASFFAVVTSSCSASTGATEELRSVVIGKCVQYKSVINPQAFCNRTLSCTDVADFFIQAFAYQDPCQVNMTRYDKYLALTRHDIVDDKYQFWSGTYDVVHRYSQFGKRVVTLEDTLSGYLIDTLRFCSSPNEPGGIGGPNATFCPTYYETEKCLWNAEASFWSVTSKDFATKSRGVVSVMLNASREEVFRLNSYFATWELPNVNSSVVTRFDIKLAHVPGDVVRHTCESDEVKMLKSHLDAKKIPYTCESNPPDLLWLLCWDHKDKRECQDFSSGAESTVTMTTAVSLPLLSLVFITLHLL